VQRDSFWKLIGGLVMSASDLTAAMKIVRGHPAMAHFIGPPEPGLIDIAERALGGQICQHYRTFVEQLGAGSFGSFEVYGLIDADFAHSSTPDAVWITMNQRREWKLPEGLVIIGDTGDGDYYCLELTGDDESPVLLWYATSPSMAVERVFDDFGAYFLDGLRRQL